MRSSKGMQRRDSMSSNGDAILIEQRNQIAVVRLNRPAQRNAMSLGLVRTLTHVLPNLDQNEAIHTIVLASANGGFCAGSDLVELARSTPAERRAFEAESGRVARLLSALSTPTIAAVSQFAIGGGLTLATSCDIVVTEPSTKWSLPEVPIGLFPAWGMSSVAQRTGRSVARRLAWGIDTLNGADAHRVGLADVVAEDAFSEAVRIGEKIAALPPKQAMSVKQYFLTDLEGETADIVANRLFMDATMTTEAHATFAKFASKA